MKPVRGKKKDGPTLEQELSALNYCLESLTALNDYEAELRIVKYLMERLKGDRKRRYRESL